MSTLKKALTKINDAYGIGTLVPLDQQNHILHIPTGVFSLDIALGGGWPLGRMCMTWGGWSSGKTTLAGLTIAQAQKLDRRTGLLLGDPTVAGNCPLPLQDIYCKETGEEVKYDDAYEVKTDKDGNETEKLKKGFIHTPAQEPMRTCYANVEGTVDARWFEKLGVDKSLVYNLTVDTGEQYIDIIDALLRDRLVDLVVVDSIAALQPTKEYEDSAGKAQVGIQARLINKAMRTWVTTLNKYKSDVVRPTFLLINQVRTDIGVMFGSPDVKPGGNAQNFTTSVDVKLYKPAHTKEDRSDADESQLMVHRSNFHVQKNKTYPSQTVGQFFIAVAPHDGFAPGEVLQLKTILDAAKRYGILSKQKSKWVLGPHKFNTLKALEKWTRKEPDEFAQFVRAMTDSITSMRAGDGKTPVLIPAKGKTNAKAK